MNFKEELSNKLEIIEEVIDKYLPKEEGCQISVLQAMNYSLLAGGKRIRPMLMQETYKLFGGEGEIIEPFMAAIEMLHTYSLVHDDLPAMDNDEFRRGRKTTHMVYGEGIAILAGDGLLNFAFETAMKTFTITNQYERTAKALQIFGRKAGVYGMIGGQVADIEAEHKPESVTEELLLFIHEHKTAALIQSAMMIGAILAGATDAEVDMVEKIGYNIGVAFQIQDDILDRTSTMEILGKPIGSDEKNNKKTYVILKGLEQSQKDVEKISREAIDWLNTFERKNVFLEQLVTQLITREK